MTEQDSTQILLLLEDSKNTFVEHEEEQLAPFNSRNSPDSHATTQEFDESIQDLIIFNIIIEASHIDIR